MIGLILARYIEMNTNECKFNLPDYLLRRPLDESFDWLIDYDRRFTLFANNIVRLVITLNSIYSELDYCELYDSERNVRWSGGLDSVSDGVHDELIELIDDIQRLVSFCLFSQSNHWAHPTVFSFTTFVSRISRIPHPVFEVQSASTLTFGIWNSDRTRDQELNSAL